MSDTQWKRSLVEPNNAESVVADWIALDVLLNEHPSLSPQQQAQLILEKVGETEAYLSFPKADSAELWKGACLVAAELKTLGKSLTLVLPKVRLMSEAALAIDTLAAHGLPRGVTGLKVLTSIDSAASALSCQRLISYVDGVVINFEALTKSVFATHEPSEQMYRSEVIEQLAFECLQLTSEVNKPTIASSLEMVTLSLKERMEDKKLQFSAALV